MSAGGSGDGVVSGRGGEGFEIEERGVFVSRSSVCEGEADWLTVGLW
jgi:hypothetical protein